MEQINLKNYPERFALCGLPIIKIAVSFDSERCTIGEWKIMEGGLCFLGWLKNIKKEQTHNIPKSFRNLYRYL